MSLIDDTVPSTRESEPQTSQPLDPDIALMEKGTIPQDLTPSLLDKMLNAYFNPEKRTAVIIPSSVGETFKGEHANEAPTRTEFRYNFLYQYVQTPSGQQRLVLTRSTNSNEFPEPFDKNIHNGMLSFVVHEESDPNTLRMSLLVTPTKAQDDPKAQGVFKLIQDMGTQIQRPFVFYGVDQGSSAMNVPYLHRKEEIAPIRNKHIAEIAQQQQKPPRRR